MATIRRRNGKYQVQVRINGYTRSKTFPSHDLAKKWATKQELIAFTEPDDRPRYVPVNFSEILAKYWEYARRHHKGASVEQIVIKALMKEHWINKPITELCHADIIEFRDRRLRSVKPDTFKRQMNIIRSAARMASENWGWICTMALFQNIKLPKQNERQVRRITPEIEARLLAGAASLRNPFMKPLIILALETGMRRGELLKLRHEDWDVRSGLISIKETKNGKNRVIPASNRARQTLCKLAQNNTHSLIPLSGNAVNLSFQRLKRRTELNWLRFHDLRHEALSRLLEFGLNIAEVKLISGHSELRQLQTYVTVDAENLRRKMSRQHCETK
jgi:integrase